MTHHCPRYTDPPLNARPMGTPLRIVGGKHHRRSSGNALVAVLVIVVTFVVLWNFSALFKSGPGPRGGEGQAKAVQRIQETSKAGGCYMPSGDWQNTCSREVIIEGPCLQLQGRQCLLKTMCRDGHKKAAPTSFKFAPGRLLELKNMNGVLCEFSGDFTQCGAAHHYNLSCFGHHQTRREFNARGVDFLLYEVPPLHHVAAGGGGCGGGGQGLALIFIMAGGGGTLPPSPPPPPPSPLDPLPPSPLSLSAPENLGFGIIC